MISPDHFLSDLEPDEPSSFPQQQLLARPVFRLHNSVLFAPKRGTIHSIPNGPHERIVSARRTQPLNWLITLPNYLSYSTGSIFLEVSRAGSYSWTKGADLAVARGGRPPDGFGIYRFGDVWIREEREDGRFYRKATFRTMKPHSIRFHFVEADESHRSPYLIFGFTLGDLTAGLKKPGEKLGRNTIVQVSLKIKLRPCGDTKPPAELTTTALIHIHSYSGDDLKKKAQSDYCSDTKVAVGLFGGNPDAEGEDSGEDLDEWWRWFDDDFDEGASGVIVAVNVIGPAPDAPEEESEGGLPPEEKSSNQPFADQDRGCCDEDGGDRVGAEMREDSDDRIGRRTQPLAPVPVLAPVSAPQVSSKTKVQERQEDEIDSDLDDWIDDSGDDQEKPKVVSPPKKSKLTPARAAPAPAPNQKTKTTPSFPPPPPLPPPPPPAAESDSDSDAFDEARLDREECDHPCSDDVRENDETVAVVGAGMVGLGDDDLPDVFLRMGTGPLRRNVLGAGCEEERQGEEEEEEEEEGKDRELSEVVQSEEEGEDDDGECLPELVVRSEEEEEKQVRWRELCAAQQRFLDCLQLSKVTGEKPVKALILGRQAAGKSTVGSSMVSFFDPGQSCCCGNDPHSHSKAFRSMREASSCELPNQFTTRMSFGRITKMMMRRSRKNSGLEELEDFGEYPLPQGLTLMDMSGLSSYHLEHLQRRALLGQSMHGERTVYDSDEEIPELTNRVCDPDVTPNVVVFVVDLADAQEQLRLGKEGPMTLITETQQFLRRHVGTPDSVLTEPVYLTFLTHTDEVRVPPGQDRNEFVQELCRPYLAIQRDDHFVVPFHACHGRYGDYDCFLHDEEQIATMCEALSFLMVSGSKRCVETERRNDYAKRFARAGTRALVPFLKIFWFFVLPFIVCVALGCGVCLVVSEAFWLLVAFFLLFGLFVYWTHERWYYVDDLIRDILGPDPLAHGTLLV